MSGELWVDKYKPVSIATMCYPAMANKLRGWLATFDPKGAGKRGCLLSGPPGIGKTTTVHVVARELGMDVVELNASDQRTEKKLMEAVASLVDSRQLTATGTTSTKKALLLMDEVDGCDRGGVGAVIRLLKTTLIPILCTCNDRWDQKLRSLVNYVEDMKFTRPPYNAVASYITERILKKEGATVPKDVLEDTIKQYGNDIRSVIGNLQLWCLGQKELSGKQLVSLSRRGMKNETVGIFDGAEAFFDSQTNRTFEELQTIFYSADLIDLFIQENYIHWNPQATSGRSWLGAVAAAANSIAVGDTISTAIYAEQNWSLSNTHMLLSALLPSKLVRGKYETFVTGNNAWFDKARPIKFPTWLGNNSSQGKHKRLLLCVTKEGSHNASGFSASAVDVVTDYLPFGIAPRMALPLVEQEKAGIPTVVEVMDNYQLTREDWEWVQEVIRYKKMASPPSALHFGDKIPTAVKTAFTREYNKTHQKESLAKSALKGIAADVLGKEAELDEADDDEPNDGSDESPKAKATPKPKPAAKAAAPKPKRATKRGRENEE